MATLYEQVFKVQDAVPILYTDYPSYNQILSRPCLSFDPAIAQAIAFDTILPDWAVLPGSWLTAALKGWYIAGANTGSVLWILSVDYRVPGQTMTTYSGTNQGFSHSVPAVAGQLGSFLLPLSSNLPVPPRPLGTVVRMMVYRLAADATDTCPGAIHLFEAALVAQV